MPVSSFYWPFTTLVSKDILVFYVALYFLNEFRYVMFVIFHCSLGVVKAMWDLDVKLVNLFLCQKQMKTHFLLKVSISASYYFCTVILITKSVFVLP